MRQPSYYKWKHTHTQTSKSPLAVNFENEWVTFSIQRQYCGVIIIMVIFAK